MSYIFDITLRNFRERDWTLSPLSIPTAIQDVPGINLCRKGFVPNVNERHSKIGKCEWTMERMCMILIVAPKEEKAFQGVFPPICNDCFKERGTYFVAIKFLGKQCRRCASSNRIPSISMPLLERLQTWQDFYQIISTIKNNRIQGYNQIIFLNLPINKSGLGFNLISRYLKFSKKNN